MYMVQRPLKINWLNGYAMTMPGSLHGPSESTAGTAHARPRCSVSPSRLARLTAGTPFAFFFAIELVSRSPELSAFRLRNWLESLVCRLDWSLLCTKHGF